MSRFMEIMAAVAPKATLRRLQAMAAVRAYDGATTGRRGSSFRAGSGGTANAALSPSLPRLRERSHDLVRNTPFAARAISVKSSHLIGTGIRVEWNTGSDKLDQQVGTAFEDWCGECDIEGDLDLPGIEGLATRAMLEGGESVIRMIDRKYKRGTVPLRLKVYEGGQIDDTKYGDNVRLGVALGEWDERLGLWLRPGENDAKKRMDSVLVPRNDLCHVFHTLRPGQLRGVPILAPVMLTNRDIADVMEAVIMKAKVEACGGLFVEAPDTAMHGLSGQAAAEMQTDAKGNREERLAPGAIIYGRAGEKAQPIPMSSTAAVEPMAKIALRSMAVGVGVTYAQLTGDMSEANYSSLKAGAIDFHRENEVIQWQVLAPKMMHRIVRRWIDRAILAGVLRPRAAGYRYNLIMPARPPIDPIKEITADIMEVRSGRMSPQEFIAMNGRPWRDVANDFRIFYAATDDLTFDTDPRRTTKQGQAQDATAPVDPTNG